MHTTKKLISKSYKLFGSNYMTGKTVETEKIQRLPGIMGVESEQIEHRGFFGQ